MKELNVPVKFLDLSSHELKGEYSISDHTTFWEEGKTPVFVKTIK